MAKIPGRVMTRSSSRVFPSAPSYDNDPTSSTKGADFRTQDNYMPKNEQIKSDEQETSPNANSSGNQAITIGSNKDDTDNNRDITSNDNNYNKTDNTISMYSTSSSSGASKSTSEISPPSQSSATLSIKHNSLDHSSRTASPIVVPTHIKTNKDTNHKTGSTNKHRPESHSSATPRVDCNNRPQSRSPQQSSVSPAPIVSTRSATTSRRGGRGGSRARSPRTTYRPTNHYSNGGKLSHTSSHLRRRRPDGAVMMNSMGEEEEGNNARNDPYDRGIPRSSKGPSSAAAAAAAAAKRLYDPRMSHSNAGGGNWYGTDRDTDSDPYGNVEEYNHHHHGRRPMRNPSDGGIGGQWPSHKSYYPRMDDPRHEPGNRRPTRTANGPDSRKYPSHHHSNQHPESFVKFGTSEPDPHHFMHHPQSHRNDDERSGQYGEIGRYDRTSNERQNEADNVFVPWNGSKNRYENEERNIDNSNVGSDSFRNGNIPQSDGEHPYQNGNDTHHNHHHLEDSLGGGGLVVVNRIKSSSMTMQNKKKASDGNGGTSRVMGSPTPIHVPRASSTEPTEHSSGNYHMKSRPTHDSSSTDRIETRSTERSSVFRTRSNCDDSISRSVECGEANNDNHKDMPSPHRLLLSLRTPTKSFDERKKTPIDVDDKENYHDKNNNKPPRNSQGSESINQDNSPTRMILLSPQEPPRIQHSHNQRTTSNPLFFSPQRTPQTPGTPRSPSNHFGGGKNHSNTINKNGGVNCPPSIDASPSFNNLFDRSFDSPFVATPHRGTSGAPIGSPQLLKDLILHQFSPNCRTPRLPPRPSHSITNSPYPSPQDFISPRPSQEYRGNLNSNRQHNAVGDMSIPSTPRESDVVGAQVETSPYGLSLGSVGDVVTDPSFGERCKSKPPIMPSAREMDKSTRDRGGDGRTLVLEMNNRLKHTPHDNEGHTIFSAGGSQIKNGGNGTREETREHPSTRNKQQNLQIPIRAKGCKDISPPLSNASNEDHNDIHLQHHSRHDPSPYVPEQQQNFPNSEPSNIVSGPIQSHALQDTRIPASSALERNKTASPLSGMNAPHFYQKLMVHKDAFRHYTFLLPALKAALSSCVEDDGDKLGSPCLGRTEEGIKTEESPPHRTMPTPQVSYSPDTKVPPTTSKPSNVEIARRRLSSALCAFGGNAILKSKNNNKRKTNCIFRRKRERDNNDISDGGECDNNNNTKSDKKTKYEESLPNRYLENENRISWDFEENPPIVISKTGITNIRTLSTGNDTRTNIGDGIRLVNGETGAKLSSLNEDGQIVDDGKVNGIVLSKFESKNHSSVSEDVKSVSSEVSSKDHGDASMSVNSDQPKMRYRCKLCGQPKQNHTCPYQQSLQRSIGVTVYPAVNAYTANEPGNYAPALSAMNNFVHGQDSFTENTPSRPDRMMQQTTGFTMDHSSAARNAVTPESIRSVLPNVSSSPPPTLSHTPHRPSYSISCGQYPPQSCPKMIIGQPTPGSLDERRKRVLSSPVHNISRSKNSAQDLLFVDSTELRPEQYRIVSSSVSLDAFVYPAIPLPYSQRKNLSDNLFDLSKEIPQLTEECAAVLREAREHDMWDIAVAELMTQVIVVVHCPENDNRLNGLSRYLLSLGFAC